LPLPHHTLAKMGIIHAKLFPVTPILNNACAAAGAIKLSRPMMMAAKAEPQIVRSGMKPKRGLIWRKKEEKGRAPSREKAQDWREVATMTERPILNWTTVRSDISPRVPDLPSASKYIWWIALAACMFPGRLSVGKENRVEEGAVLPEP
jgi:hypothetical protein